MASLRLHSRAAEHNEVATPYGSYGGVYVTVALIWLWLVNDQQADRRDILDGVIRRRHGCHRDRAERSLFLIRHRAGIVHL